MNIGGNSVRYLMIMLVIFIAGCQTTKPDGAFYGENLAIPNPELYEGWNVKSSSPKNKNYFALGYLHPEKGIADSFLISKKRGIINDLHTERKEIDDYLEEPCISFESEIIDKENTKPYDSIFWQTTCEVDAGKTNRTINLLIQGTDHSFYISKGWKVEVNADTLKEWTELFSGIFFCDTRKPNLQCPEGITRIDGI